VLHKTLEINPSIGNILCLQVLHLIACIVGVEDLLDAKQSWHSILFADGNSFASVMLEYGYD
jgi:hypothetical protein